MQVVHQRKIVVEESKQFISFFLSCLLRAISSPKLPSMDTGVRQAIELSVSAFIVEIITTDTTDRRFSGFHL
jgi:hypothetical protein